MPVEKKDEKPLTLSQFTQFYNEAIDPRFRNIENEMKELRNEFIQFRHEVNQRFDFLFKKFEDLRQEYIIVKHQMKRSDEFQETIKKEVVDLKSKIANLQKEVEELERHLQAH